MRNYDMGQMQISSSGLDSFWEQKDRESRIPPEVQEHRRRRRAKAARRNEKVARQKAAARRKISSIDDLDGFVRVAGSNALVRKSEQDLWALKEDDEGSIVIEPLYDGEGKPLKV